MSDGPRHATDDFQIGGLKSAMSGASTSSATRSADDLQSQYTRDEAQAKETQYTLLQLVSMVRENPILYDEELQSTIPETQLKKQKREAWIRIRGDMMWQNMTPVQDVWSELLDQYLRKSDELSDSIIEAMRWTDSAIDKKKSDSRPPSQLNNMASSLEKDFFAEVPMTEDVLVPGQTMEGPASINIMRDYVVIQPTRRIGEMESPNTGAASQYSRRKSPESRETEAIVRTYPLGAKRGNIHIRPPTNTHDVLLQKVPKSSQIKKGEEIPSTQINFGRQGVLVEVEPAGYATPSQKLYKMIGSQRIAPSEPTGRRQVFQMARGNSLNYESLPPEPLIESPNISAEPPSKKKMHLDNHHRSVSLVGPPNPTIAIIPKNRVDNTIASVLIGQRTTDKILPEGIPIAEDEIILETTGESLRECKPFVEGQNSLLNVPPGNPGSSHDPSTSAEDMHHYHHQDIEDGGGGEDIEQQVVVEGQPDDMAIQYDEDLAFQQHINSVLNRLSDDEKTVMKFNMQKIILDARFGIGTARSMLKCDDMMEVQAHVEIDPSQEANDVQI